MSLPAAVLTTAANKFVVAPSSQDPATLTTSTTGAMVLGLDSVPMDRTANLQDATTQLTNGYYQSAPTVLKWSGTANGKAIAGTPLSLVEGHVYAVNVVFATNGTMYGYVRIDKIHEQYVGPSALATYSFDFVNEGPYTVVQPT